MEVFMIVMIFYVGTFFGSFYNVVINRLSREVSLVHIHSYCPNCGHYLRVVDLLPILNFFYLREKCRYCNQGMSIRNLSLEILIGLLFLLAFYKYGWTSFSLIQIVFWGMLILVGFIDYDTMYIYDSMLLFYFIVFMMYYGA